MEARESKGRMANALPAGRDRRIRGTRRRTARALLGAVLFVAVAVPPAAAATFEVDSTGDAGDANAGDGACDTGAGQCTLRAAIQEANALDGPDVVEFDVAGAGPHTIQPATELDTVTEPLLIDGLSQPGADCSSWPPTLLIELDGSSGTEPSQDGLRIQAGSSTVRGLVINRFEGDGIVLDIAGGNTVHCNFIGTDVTGVQDRGNGDDGVDVLLGDGNGIGGTAVSSRNLISGNDSDGILLSGSDDNVVAGNFIGTDVSGFLPVGNGGLGVSVTGSGNRIGGTLDGAGNVISANGEAGVDISSDSDDTRVIGNRIGTDAAGSGDLGNSSHGVRVAGSGNEIGGVATAAGNTIAFNLGDGVSIESIFEDPVGNSILSNAIFSNDGLGIDLEPDGVTPNDGPGDPDEGANDLQNFPVLTRALSGATSLVEGTLESTPDREFRVEIFTGTTCDASGFGEGAALRTSTSVTTDAGGTASFSLTVPGPLPGIVTATATDAETGNTSEFSECAIVETLEADLALDKTVDGAGPFVVGETVSFTLTVTNLGPHPALETVVTDALPPELAFVAAVPSQGSCAEAGGAVTCDLGNLASGDDATIALTAEIVAPGTVVNTASAASAASDPDPGNSSDSAEIEAAIHVAIDDVSRLEGDAGSTPFDFTVSVSSTAVEVQVTAETVDGSATAGDDYTAVPPTVLTFSQGGPLTQTVTVQVAGDTDPEPDETFTVELSNPSAGAVLADASGLGTIEDDDAAEFQADVVGTKEAGGDLTPGGTVVYTIVLTNLGPGLQLDNPEDELIDVLPAELELVSAAADSGTATADPGTNTVTWNGEIPTGDSVTISIEATIPEDTPLGTEIANQGTIRYDADGLSSNEATRPTDDPATADAEDPTVFLVLPASVLEIPTLGEWDLWLLALLLAAGGAVALRR